MIFEIKYVNRRPDVNFCVVVFVERANEYPTEPLMMKFVRNSLFNQDNELFTA